MDDETQREKQDGKPCEPDVARDELRASHEREIWLRDRFDRERAENLLLLRYLSAQRESGLMRFWRWLIDDLRDERRLDCMAMCIDQPVHCTEPPKPPDNRPRLLDRLILWSANFFDRFRKKSRT